MADTETNITAAAPAQVLVLKDQVGDYFLLPQETLERGRVPQERKAEIEQLIAERQTDVQGYVGFIAHAVISLAQAVAIGAGALYRQYELSQEEIVVPTIQFPPSSETIR